VTTNDTAAAGRLARRLILAATTALGALGLAGCETSTGLLTSNEPPPAQVASPAHPAPQPSVRVAIAPVIGAPDALGKQLGTQVADAAERQRVGIVRNPADKAEYTVRGYVVAARDSAGTKVSYIWDVTDSAGKRVNRITGEEMAPAAPGRDPWSAVTPTIMQSVAEKTGAALGAWAATQAGQPAVAGSAGPPSGVGVQPGSVASSAPQAQPAIARETVAATPAAAGPASTTTTGSIPRSDTLTHVAGITGAPGDGNAALAGALQRELSRNGIAVSERAAAGAYKVEAKVQLGKAAGGKQPIQIDWVVKDPKGARLGTVSQKNDIEPGSLDATWGKTADLAAAAAAQGILKLLPAKATN
jgi:hypothetical protein